jgi:hypothetical protein
MGEMANVNDDMQCSACSGNILIAKCICTGKKAGIKLQDAATVCRGDLGIIGSFFAKVAPFERNVLEAESPP